MASACEPVLELYVWGEGFNAPSIEPECVASIVFFSTQTSSPAFPTWSIINGQDSQISPTGEFPALYDRVSRRWVAGFPAIARYIRHSYLTVTDEMTDGIASYDVDVISTFVSTKGKELLDLYLYASYDNYYNCTSAAWTRLLPWYSNYTIPASKRRAAQARTAHLGVTSLDVDNVHDLPLTGPIGDRSTPQATGPSSAASAMMSDQQRKNRRLLLNKTTHSDAFRLRRLADSFFTTLTQYVRKVHGKASFGPDRLSVVECLLIGYLSIILNAPVPNRWLASILNDNYPELVNYAQPSTFSASVSTSNPRAPELSGTSQSGVVRSDQVLHIRDAISIASRNIIGSLPIIGSVVDMTTVSRQTTPSEEVPAEDNPSMLPASPALHAGFGALIVGLISVAVWRNTSMKPWFLSPISSQSSNNIGAFQDFGEAGGFLSALGNQMAFESGIERERDRLGGASISVMEIDTANESSA